MEAGIGRVCYHDERGFTGGYKPATSLYDVGKNLHVRVNKYILKGTSKMVWDEQTKDYLRSLWRELAPSGNPLYSAQEIARRIGVSKNAIVGQAHRLELERRPSPIRYYKSEPKRSPRALPSKPDTFLPPLKSESVPVWPPTGTAAPAKPSKPELVPTKASIRPPAPPTPVPLGIVRDCLWPIGEPKAKDFRFCSDPSVPGKVYCEAHCKIAFVRVRVTHAEYI